MSAQPKILRRKSRQIMVGNVPVGGDAPISVQSMTNTETCDVAATVAQIQRLENVGADIVRVSVPSMEAADAFRERLGDAVASLADHREKLLAMAQAARAMAKTDAAERVADAVLKEAA